MLQQMVAVAPILGPIIALLSFGFAVVAFRRTSRLQDADYRPYIAFYGGIAEEDNALAEDQTAIAYDGGIKNVGLKPVHVIKARVLLGPLHRDDPECVIQLPLNSTIPINGKHRITFTLQWDTVRSVARHFSARTLRYDMVVTLRGADGVTRENQRLIAFIMQAPDTEWHVIEPSVFAELLQKDWQDRLRGDA